MSVADRLRAFWSEHGIRGLAPSWRGWLDGLAHASTYLLILAFVATAIAKAHHLRFIQDVSNPALALVLAVALDLVVYAGLIITFSLVEQRWPVARYLTIASATLLAAFAVLNAVYLTIAGDQASRSAVEAFFARFGDVVAIFEHAATPAYAQALIGGTLGALIIHFAARRFTRRGREDPFARVLIAGWLALVAGLFVALAPRPHRAELRRLGRNVLVTLVRSIVAPPNQGRFAGYDKPESAPTPAPSPDEIHPNIIMLVLESTRWDHTDMFGEGALASTPNLAALADRGFSAETVRAVMPHTTKALFTMLCGRLPLLQRELWELSDDIRPDCIPDMLRRVGYKTAFIQSAQGLFEQRARLVDKLGYDHFVPWEDIRGQRLGYLASDDASMLRPMRRWLDEIEPSGAPFFITLLTSSPHHPYKLPTRIRERAEREKLPHETDAEKYARLVEGEDDLIGKLQDLLQFRSLGNNTILIVLGDHGEGFGKHSSKQHDQNLYEEGIRVPWVVAGPGIKKRLARGNANALDFTPTILGLLDMGDAMPPPSDFPGVDLSRDDVPPDRPRWLSCWFMERCRGFVVGKYKVMEELDTGEVFHFDLEQDPDEQNPLPLTRDLKLTLEQMNQVFDAHRISDREIIHPELRKYGLWWCPKDDDKCKHPRARHPDFRYKLDPSETDPLRPVRLRPPGGTSDEKAGAAKGERGAAAAARKP